MPRRPVRRSAEFVRQARALFPPGGSSAGRPSFEVFEQGPLRGAEAAFSFDFEAQRRPIQGVASIRQVIIPPTLSFGPLLISACLISDGAVELASVIEDEGYWDLVGNDPAD